MTAATPSAANQAEFSGGRVVKVIFEIAKDVHVDVERKMAAAMARDLVE